VPLLTLFAFESGTGLQLNAHESSYHADQFLELTGFRTGGNLSLWDRPNDQLAPTAGTS
jgi:hypothetical protein